MHTTLHPKVLVTSLYRTVGLPDGRSEGTMLEQAFAANAAFSQSVFVPVIVDASR